MNLDFTYSKYEQIIQAIAASNYKTLTIAEYINAEKLPDKFIILRHDVDLDPYYQLQFARLEHSHNIRSSYYFRHIPAIFKEEVIHEVHALGHEVGYHYEVFTKAKGDPEAAMKLFRDEQEVFKQKWGSTTVCPHGGSFIDTADGYSLTNILKLLPGLLSGKKVFSKHINFDMWSHHNFAEFAIAGDAYRSVNFKNMLYLSDTGRSWKQRYKRLDKVDSDINGLFQINSSDDIINIISHHKTNQIYLLVHFEQWKNNLPDWLAWYAAQIIRRTGKRLIFRNK